MNIGERIRTARESADLSQTELAEKIGISRQLMYKYENSIITNIPSDKIELISSTCHVSPAYIMGWVEEQNASDYKKQISVYNGEMKMLEKFRLLDDIDQNRIVERIDIMLEDDKYKKADKGDKVG